MLVTLWFGFQFGVVISEWNILKRASTPPYRTTLPILFIYAHVRFHV